MLRRGGLRASRHPRDAGCMTLFLEKVEKERLTFLGNVVVGPALT
jgi:hypothetical protein